MHMDGFDSAAGRKAVAGSAAFSVRKTFSPLASAKALAPLSLALAMAGCAANPQQVSGRAGGVDAKYGVTASPRVVADGAPVPHGGGNYMVGKPYTIAGKTYYPSERTFSAIGTASWYGSDFHGRKTANGEIFDKASISAAHPTMPLPSYARVTNLRNNSSIVVRVNDRGPFHGGRVMDVSQRVAEALDFKQNGTARVRVEYLSKAALGGSDDRKLLASLRQDGSPAQLDSGAFAPPTLVASAPPPPKLDHVARPQPLVMALAKSPVALAQNDEPEQPAVSLVPVSRPLQANAHAPLPPSRPFDLGTIPGAGVPIAAGKPSAKLGQVSFYVSTPISLSDRFEQRGPFEGLKPQQLQPLRTIAPLAQ